MEQIFWSPHFEEKLGAKLLSRGIFFMKVFWKIVAESVDRFNALFPKDIEVIQESLSA